MNRCVPMVRAAASSVAVTSVRKRLVSANS